MMETFSPSALSNVEATGKVATVTAELNPSFYFIQIYSNLSSKCNQGLLYWTARVQTILLGQVVCEVDQKERRRVSSPCVGFSCKSLQARELQERCGGGREHWRVVSGEGRWVQISRWAGPLIMAPSAQPKTLTLPSLPSRMTQNHTSLEFFVSRLALKSSPLGLPSTKALT